MIGRTNVQGYKIKENEYTELEYIESTGTQYIDTGFKPNQNTKVELKLSSSETNKGYFGCNTSTKGFVFYEENGNYKYKYNIDGKTSSVAHSNDVITFVIDKNKVYMNENNIITATSGSFSTDYNAYIFGWNQAGTLRNPCSMKLYYCKIYEDGVVVKDFIPILDKNNVACLFDKVSETFFYNKGTGSFTAGPVI